MSLINQSTQDWWGNPQEWVQMAFKYNHTLSGCLRKTLIIPEPRVNSITSFFVLKESYLHPTQISPTTPTLPDAFWHIQMHWQVVYHWDTCLALYKTDPHASFRWLLYILFSLLHYIFFLIGLFWSLLLMIHMTYFVPALSSSFLRLFLVGLGVPYAVQKWDSLNFLSCP